MRYILLIAGVYLLLCSMGLRDIKVVSNDVNSDVQSLNQKDTLIKVAYFKKGVTDRIPAWYLNSRLIDAVTIQTIDPKKIATINIEKQEIEIANKNYYGQLFIKTIQTYIPELLSLNMLIATHTSLEHEPSLILIDNETVNGNYDEISVDENFILSISVEKIENSTEGLSFNLIRILARSDENVADSKKIFIRGGEIPVL